MHAEDLQDAAQVVVVEESNFERAFALVIAEMHFGSQALSQAVLHIGQVSGLTIVDGGGGHLNRRGGSLQLRDELLVSRTLRPC